ncbi:unnamed protein product [Parnassius mnemosyne]|uniref:Uncharacterized protein n=1 Tax=Parnassius mnemosyne TaxID=213953 RepID=A0AAV1M0P9_9NEOP
MAERMLFLGKLKEAASQNKGNEDRNDLTNSEQEGSNKHKSSLPLHATSSDENIENDINYNNTSAHLPRLLAHLPPAIGKQKNVIKNPIKS